MEHLDLSLKESLALYDKPEHADLPTLKLLEALRYLAKQLNHSISTAEADPTDQDIVNAFLKEVREWETDWPHLTPLERLVGCEQLRVAAYKLWSDMS